MKQLIVTADDLGLSEKINLGIVKAHTQGIVTAASLLINAPATEHAITLAKKTPTLQIGLHLGIVESFSLSKNPKFFAVDPYWDQDCLPRNWQEFLRRQLFRYSDEWYTEFELQIKKFISIMGPVPFLNSTQHLHLFPGMQKIVISLCQKYQIPYVRTASNLIYSETLSQRPIQSLGCKMLSKLLPFNKISSPEYLLGIDEAGKLNTDSLIKLIGKIPNGLSELLVHPGVDDPILRASLPKTFQAFNWQGELDGLISENIKKLITDKKIKLRHF